jgi:hypothetical protein
VHIAFLIGILVSVPFLLIFFVYRVIRKPPNYAFRDELVHLLLGGLMGLYLMFKSWITGVLVVRLIWLFLQ